MSRVVRPNGDVQAFGVANDLDDRPFGRRSPSNRLALAEVDDRVDGLPDWLGKPRVETYRAGPDPHAIARRRRLDDSRSPSRLALRAHDADTSRAGRASDVVTRNSTGPRSSPRRLVDPEQWMAVHVLERQIHAMGSRIDGHGVRVRRAHLADRASASGRRARTPTRRPTRPRRRAGATSASHASTSGPSATLSV